jgi:uncharacterized damage-inducible protein DinB
MPDCIPWTQPLCALLEQGARLAERLDRESFACVSALAPTSSMGAHLRHVADYVQAFLRDLEAGTIDYDRRARDERAEREPARAAAELRRLCVELEGLARRDPRRELSVRAEACLVGDEPQRSTLARELGVLLSHTVHHYALIAVLLRARGLEPPSDLGVAPSTLAHWARERATCAPRAG